ncbi:MAG: hypothetical protein FK732_07035 [Asgard group archaeon]|nr:hypothetical protein [Asgard group archaeon]
MNFDIVLPTALFFVVSVSVLLYKKVEKPVALLLEDRKLTVRDAVFMVLSMGIMVTVIVFIPNLAIQIVFIGAYSYMLFAFTYLAMKKWYIAVLAPAVFILSYFFFWHIAVYNIFVIVFGIIIILYLSSLFTWKTVLIFMILLTIMDIIQVFITGFMGQSATKLITLELPVLLKLPTYPFPNRISFLGLGDVFLAGLLAVQTSIKNGQKAGIITAVTNWFVFFVFGFASINKMFVGLFDFFPATILVLSGWALGIGLLRLTQINKQQI